MDEEATMPTGITGTIDPKIRYPPSVSDLTDRIHLLPCSIKLDGSNEISHYCKPKDTDVVDGLSVKEAFFRGRKLQGATVPIPEGYRGFVLDKRKLKKWRKRVDRLEGDFSHWESRAEFRNLTYWNHDTFPFGR